MGRRSGNPFFTGSSNSSAGGAGGSWLFRPAQPGVSKRVTVYSGCDLAVNRGMWLCATYLNRARTAIGVTFFTKAKWKHKLIQQRKRSTRMFATFLVHLSYENSIFGHLHQCNLDERIFIRRSFDSQLRYHHLMFIVVLDTKLNLGHHGNNKI